MTKQNFREWLRRHLPWVREHELIVQTTRRAIEESEALRRDIASKLTALRPEVKQSKNA